MGEMKNGYAKILCTDAERSSGLGSSTLSILQQF